MHPELDRLIDPGYAEGLTEVELDELRHRRASCQQREESVSYLRRIIQVRLDLLGVELGRRQAGESPASTDDLIEQLPDVLAEHTRAPGLGQAPRDLKLPDIDDDLAGLVDEIISPRQLSELGGLDDAELHGLIDQLEELEHEVSAVRRQLQVHIDSLQAEVTRRYRSGEATVDSLLE